MILDSAHPLLVLAARIDWPAERLLAGLHLLGILRGLRDDDLVEAWVENPYFQAFCGEIGFHHALPATGSDLVAWRLSMGTALDDWTASILPPSAVKPHTFVVDVDGVVNTLTPGNDYNLARPIPENIAVINRLYDHGHRIVMMTARGSATGISWEELTRSQFERWGLKYHELRFGKPAADYYVDDRILSVEMMRAMALGRDFPPSSRAPRLTEADVANEHHK